MSNKKENKAPMGISVVIREFKKDKIAQFSLFLFVTIMLIVFIGSLLIDQKEIMRVSLIDSYAAPFEGFWLGADSGGRSILGQLIIGARNSIVIGFSVTIITTTIGIILGLIVGYYAGKVDNIIMRLIDFIMILPAGMIIIVVIIIIPNFTIFNFILILSLFGWIGTTRLVRSKSLSESRKDYIQASKTLGTSDFKIIFFELLPNISSIILVNLTLGLAGSIGMETGLTFLGYGLPPSTPSLGTLISYAQKPEVISSKPWVWLPASLLILVLMLCINYMGDAFKRASDAQQRLG